MIQYVLIRIDNPAFYGYYNEWVSGMNKAQYFNKSEASAARRFLQEDILMVPVITLGFQKYIQVNVNAIGQDRIELIRIPNRHDLDRGILPLQAKDVYGCQI